MALPGATEASRRSSAARLAGLGTDPPNWSGLGGQIRDQLRLRGDGPQDHADRSGSGQKKTLLYLCGFAAALGFHFYPFLRDSSEPAGSSWVGWIAD
jgi:hypothetical protein